MNSQSLMIENNRRAREAALSAWALPETPPDALRVRYQSLGRILLIGGEDALLYAPRLGPELRAQVLVTDGSDEPSVPVIFQAGRRLAIDGHLGHFRVELGEPGQRDHEVIDCDLILDLAAQPVLERELLPVGYYRPVNEPLVLDALVDELKGMVGQFEKPKYFNLDPALCAHGRNGVIGCSRCIEACPAEAISDDGDAVAVDPALCQGGGGCASVCPSGAIRYAQPDPLELQEQLRLLVTHYREQGGRDPVVVFQAEAHAFGPDAFAPNLLPVTVEELASVGMETLLGLLAWGVAGVRLLEHPGLPERSRRVIDGQLAVIEAMLRALGRDSRRIGWMQATRPPMTEALEDESFKPASFRALGGKRQRLFQAIDHLYGVAPVQPVEVPLSPAAPFASAEIAEDRCTLCLACTGACPGGALQAAGEQPGIRFIEMNCVNCGLCVQTCPEDAIRIRPRLLFDPDARRTARTLHQEPAFACIACGKPFATRRIIDAVLHKLEGNPMFATSESRRRLQMCDDCRIADLAQNDLEQLTGVPAGVIHD